MRIHSRSECRDGGAFEEDSSWLRQRACRRRLRTSYTRRLRWQSVRSMIHKRTQQDESLDHQKRRSCRLPRQSTGVNVDRPIISW